MTLPPAARRIAFLDFVLDRERGCLFGPSGEVHLRPQAYRLLEVLVDSAPRVLSRDELMDRAWGAEHLSPSVLKQTISEIRQALGDEAGDPTYIATLPRRGYRFLAPLRQLDDLEAEATAQEAHTGARAPETSVRDDRSLDRAVRSVARWPLRRRPAAALLVSVLLGVFLLAALLLWRAQLPGDARAEAAPRPAVAVLGFKNLAERPDQAWIGAAIEELMGLEVVAQDGLRWVPGESVATMQRDLGLGERTPSEASLRRIRQHSGADLVIRGSYLLTETEAAGLEVQLVVLDTEQGEAVLALSSTASVDELVPLTQRLARRIWSQLDFLSGSVEGNGPQHLRVALPGSGRALELYASGSAAARRMDWQQAADLLKEAAALEPSSPLVHDALAVAWERLGFDQRAAASARRAQQLAADLPAAVRLRLEARAASLSGQWQEAEELYRVLWRLHEDDPEVALGLALVQRRAGKPRQAESTLEELRLSGHVDPDDPRLRLLIARLASDLGDVERSTSMARAAWDEARARGHEQVMAAAEHHQAWMHVSKGDLEQALAEGLRAEQRYREAGNRGGAAGATATVAALLARVGRSEEAEEQFELALAELIEVGDRSREAAVRNNFAAFLGRSGRVAQATAQLEISRNIKREVDDLSGLALASVNLGMSHLHRGDLSAAGRLAEEVLELRDQLQDPQRVALALRLQSRLHAAAGRWDEARSGYREAHELFAGAGYSILAHHIGEQMALLAFDGGDFEAMDQQLRAAIQGYERDGEQHRASSARLELARLSLLGGRTAVAKEQLNQALAVSEELPPKMALRLRARALTLGAEAMLICGETRQARQQLQGALALYEQLDNPEEAAASRIAMVRVDLIDGELGDAARILEQMQAEPAVSLAAQLRLPLAALQRDSEASLGQCDEPSKMGAMVEWDLTPLRVHERLVVTLDRLRAAMRCGLQTDAQPVLQQAEALGYTGLQLRARQTVARFRNDRSAQAALREEAENLGFGAVARATLP